MALYRKKPVTVRAWQWMFSPEQEQSPTWVDDALNIWPEVGGVSFEPDHPSGPRLCLATLEGVMVARPGDWVICGVIGELYACRADIFALTYERVDCPKGCTCSVTCHSPCKGTCGCVACSEAYSEFLSTE